MCDVQEDIVLIYSFCNHSLRFYKYVMDIISRKRAKIHNLGFYFTGKPCKRGHVTKRRVDNATCQSCAILKSKDCESKDPQRWRAYYAQYRADNAEHLPKQDRRWAKTNPGKIRAQTIRRNKHIKQATPDWANTKKISKIYVESAHITKKTNIPHQVDHIIPIRGKDVCGLHIEGNLRVITAKENLAKGNKLDESLI